MSDDTAACKECDGEGRWFDASHGASKQCRACKGTGKVQSDDTATVRLPGESEQHAKERIEWERNGPHGDTATAERLREDCYCNDLKVSQCKPCRAADLIEQQARTIAELREQLRQAMAGIVPNGYELVKAEQAARFDALHFRWQTAMAACDEQAARIDALTKALEGMQHTGRCYNDLGDPMIRSPKQLCTRCAALKE